MKQKILCIFLILGVVVSCSRLDLAVNLANTYIVSKTDDFFNLTSDQKKWLKGALSRDIDRVKKTILPQLASELNANAQKISSTGTFDMNMVLEVYNRVEGIFYQGLKVFSSDAVAFADQLTPAQVNYFQKEFHEKVSELKEKPEKKSYDRIKKHFDSWMGMMNSNQKKELKNFISTNPPKVDTTIAHREALAQGFVKSYANKDTRKQYVEKLFNQYESLKDPAYAKMTEDKSKKVAGMVAKVLNMASADQKDTLVETLRDRANQLVKISRE